MLIPDVPRMRETPPFEPTGEIKDQHVPWHDDFCLNCGADLRIPRVLVNTVTLQDSERLILCESAERASHGEPADEAEMNRLGFSTGERQKLIGMLLDGIIPVVDYRECGLERSDLVGITVDGTYLYKREASSST